MIVIEVTGAGHIITTLNSYLRTLLAIRPANFFGYLRHYWPSEAWLQFSCSTSLREAMKTQNFVIRDFMEVI